MTNQPHLRLAGRRQGELFSDPTANAIWAGFLTLDVATQHDFLDRLRERLAVPEGQGGTHAIRVSRLVAAIREADGLLAAQASAEPGFDPTQPPALTEDAFEALRKNNKHFRWPAASSLRAWVHGGWNDVLARAGVKEVDGGDALFVVSGGRYQWEEMSRALRDYRDYLIERGHDRPEDFGMWDYINWAKLPHILARPGRRPQSQAPFDNYGGFLTAKVAALANEEAPRGDLPRRRAARSGHVRPTSGYGYTDEELIAAVREVVAFRDGSVPRASEFRSARRTLLESELAEGKTARPFPSYNVLLHRWKPWDAVLVKAGYEPFGEVVIDEETGRGVIEGPRNHISDADLLKGLAEAFEQRGKPFKFGTYKQYLADRGRRSLAGRRMATYACIYARYRDVAGERGPFKYACDLALPEGWEQLDD
jgi:hypothetical protein